MDKKLRCIVCNKLLQRGRSKFCSFKCLGKYRHGEGNPFYGRKHTKAYLKKRSLDTQGNKNPFYGRKHSKKTKRKIGKSSREREHPPLTEDWKKKISISVSKLWDNPVYKQRLKDALKGRESPRKGVKLSEKTKKLISEKHLGKKLSLETRRRISEGGKKAFSKPEVKAKLSRARKKLWKNPEYRKRMSDNFSGNKNPAWRGGVSKFPYDWNFNYKTKNKVRRRDGNKCVICNSNGNKRSGLLCVHHIHENKKKSYPKNLITLCTKCHLAYHWIMSAKQKRNTKSFFMKWIKEHSD